MEYQNCWAYSPLISYPETDFITIIAGLPGSWQLLPFKTLNSLADNCCGSVVLSAGRRVETKEKDYCLQRFSIALSLPGLVLHSSAVHSFCTCPSGVTCGSQPLSLQQPPILANSNNIRHMMCSFSSFPFFFFLGDY